MWALNPRKAPGADGITGWMLREGWRAFGEEWTAIFNDCWRKGRFLDSWKVGSMIHSKQFGFVRGRITVDAIKCVMEWVGRRAAKYVLGVFIDIEGTFDISHHRPPGRWSCVGVGAWGYQETYMRL